MNQGAHGLVNDVWTYLEEQVVGSSFTQTPNFSPSYGHHFACVPQRITRMLVSGDSLVELVLNVPPVLICSTNLIDSMKTTLCYANNKG